MILIFVQGDMIMTGEQVRSFNGTGEFYKNVRGIAPDWAKLWNISVYGEPGKVGVPYMLSPKFTDPQKEKFLKAMQEIEEKSCVRYYYIESR